MTLAHACEIPCSHLVQVACAAVIALNHGAVHSIGALGADLVVERSPIALVGVGREGRFVAQIVHHDVELGGRFGVVVLFGVVVHGINFGHGFLEGLEVLVEDGISPRSLRVDEVPDVSVRIVAPTADADFNASDAGRLGLEVSDVLLIVRLCLCEDIFPVFANRFAVGLERAVGIYMHIEEDEVRESGIAEFCDGSGSSATDMAASIDAGHLSVLILCKRIGKNHD